MFDAVKMFNYVMRNDDHTEAWIEDAEYRQDVGNVEWLSRQYEGLDDEQRAIVEAGEYPRFDDVGFIMDFEGGECSNVRAVQGMQHFINTGMAWSLQGFYGRTAHDLIDRGYCVMLETLREAA